MMRVLSVVALALALCACGSARRGEPFGNAPVIDTAAEKRGQKIFMANCHACHTGGGGALGPALNDKPLPGWVLRYQVRHGLGAMPAFSREHLGDAELDDLVVYLKSLRRGAPAGGGQG